MMRPKVELSRDYEAALRLLCSDLEEVFEYVEPVDHNLSTYSHRLYALLLRSCTEIESLLKELGRALQDPTRQFQSMPEYASLDRDYHLSHVAVDALMWLPRPRRIVPFSGWADPRPRLPWYQSYNAVKHNRSNDFPSANVINTLEAVAGVFPLVAVAGSIPSDGAHLQRPGGMWDGRRGFVGLPFELINAWSSDARPVQ